MFDKAYSVLDHQLEHEAEVRKAERQQARLTLADKVTDDEDFRFLLNVLGLDEGD